MVKIRLKRFGKKNQATFRLVSIDSRKGAQGKEIENLGFINPHTKESKIIKDRVNYWLKVGAQPTRTVHNLLVKNKVIKAKKIQIVMKSKKKDAEKKEEKKAEK